MTDTEFNELADAALDRIESSLDALDVDVDSERKAGGVLELEFENGSKIIINRQPAMREIWVAAKSGGYPFVFFAAMMVLQFVVVLLFYPETKGLSLEELQKKLGIG